MVAAWRSVVCLWYKPLNLHQCPLQRARQLSSATSGSVTVYEDDQLPFPAQQLPLPVWKTMQQIRAAGHVVLLVGGAVRDLLLGVTPKDYDLLTSAHLAQVKQLVHRGRIFGRHFPICQLDADGVRIEVSSMHTRPPYRLATAAGAAGAPGAAAVPPDAVQVLQLGPEAATAAAVATSASTQAQLGRHRRSNRAITHLHQQPHASAAGQQQLQPPQLSWAAVRRHNAQGRDFTVNCLMYDPFAGLLYDYVGGVPDLQSRLLRCNGDPHTRFNRDPACMLRAVRCAARAGLSIDSATLAALQRHGQLLTSALNAQRLTAELLALLAYGSAAPSLRLLAHAQILQHVLPQHDLYMQQHRQQSSSLLGTSHTKSGQYQAAVSCDGLGSTAAGPSDCSSIGAATESGPKQLQHGPLDSGQEAAASALGQLWCRLSTDLHQDQPQQHPQRLGPQSAGHPLRTRMQHQQELQQQHQQLADANLLLRVLSALDQQVCVSQPASPELVLACLTAPLLVDTLQLAVLQLQQLVSQHGEQLQEPTTPTGARASVAAVAPHLSQQQQEQHVEQQQQQQELLDMLHQVADLVLRRQGTAEAASLLHLLQGPARSIARNFSSSSSSSGRCGGGTQAGQSTNVCNAGATAFLQQMSQGMPFGECVQQAACQLAAAVCSGTHWQEGVPLPVQLFGAHSPGLAADLLERQLDLSRQQQSMRWTARKRGAAAPKAASTAQGASGIGHHTRSGSSKQQHSSRPHVDLWDDYAAALPRSNKQFRQLMQRQWGQQLEGFEAGFVGSVDSGAVLLATAGAGFGAAASRPHSGSRWDEGGACREEDEEAVLDDSHVLHRVLQAAGVDLLHFQQKLHAPHQSMM